MTCIYDKEVNKIAELNLLNGIINTLKRDKRFNTYYSPIIHGFMNTRKGIAKFKNFQILLDSGCSSMILIVRLVKNQKLKKYAVMQWNKQDGTITNNLKVKVYFTLTTLSAKNVVTWKYHVGDSVEGGYNMILVRDILT